LSIKRPDGVTVASTLLGTGGGTLSVSLAVGGAYSLTVDPQSAGTGGATVTAT
jgi:hypothetical protein